MPRRIRGVLFDVGGTLLREGTGEPYPGVHQTLETLGKSYTLAVITNTETRTENDVRMMFRSLGLESLFSCFVVSLDVGWWKPHPEIFNITLELSNLKPHESVMVGNRVDLDIVGGKRVGLATVLIDYEDKVDVETLVEAEKPNAKVTSLAQLSSVLENLQAGL
ncbi:MAG: HAD family hydrolase [Candidatus Bathyarchaeia archaeon]